jgi:tetratricopeptide (TPR) repeat protein
MAILILHEKTALTLDNYDQVLQAYSKVTDLDLQRINAYNAIAWFLSTSKDPKFRNGKKAVEYGEKALSLCDAISDDNTKAALYDTLGAAYAESGDFGKAVSMELSAYNLVESIGGKNKARDIYKELIEVYRNEQTYVQWEVKNSNR